MKITKRQLADLLDGIGSSWISSGGYENDKTVMTEGSIVKEIAVLVRHGETESFEIPTERTFSR